MRFSQQLECFFYSCFNIQTVHHLVKGLGGNEKDEENVRIFVESIMRNFLATTHLQGY
jgi:hypothetical protein